MTDQVIDVHVGGPTSRRVSPDLWGLFLEDINYSLDGGLNADLVRNGDFEATPADHPGWGPLTGWTVEPGGGAVQVRSAEPVSSANATYVRLVPGGSAGDVVRLVNGGYDDAGMAVRAVPHRLRLAGRAGAGARLTAELRHADGSGLGAGPVDLPLEPAPGWTWIEADLPPGSAAHAVLVLAAAGGVVDVDLVELRPVDPATGEPELFRRDLVEALRALRPAFVRFPGGCVAHGYGLDNMYHWKTTTGPRAERRPMTNVWGYHQSMAIGYHEYFLLCEELGATPLPVVAAGVCCQNVPGGPQAIPAERMPQYVQDVLDLVEYANGDGSTRWGAVRAANGHPEPFGLRYLGIGNEDVISDDFVERFTALWAAVRAEYPGLAVVGTAGPYPSGQDFEAGWELARDLRVPLVDEHAYRSPRWFLQNLDRYEHYDRSGPGVYLGEWAARTSTARSAVAEAAFMVAVERSSDVVRLASYAPLLARVGSTQWTPDLLYFTSDEVRPTFSYHVQRMLAENRGETVLDVRVDPVALRSQPAPALLQVRFRSTGSTTEFRDVTLDGVPQPRVVVGPEDDALLDAPAGARRLELTAHRLDGEEGFAVEFGDPTTGTLHTVHVGGWRNRLLVLSRTDDGIDSEVDGPFPFDGVTTAVPLTVRVEVDGARIRTWVDGRLVHDHEDDQRPWPDFVAGATGVGSARHVTVVNASDEHRQVRVYIEGMIGPMTAAATLLAGSDPEAGALFESAPGAPEPGTVHGDGHLPLTLPPWSVATARVTP